MYSGVLIRGVPELTAAGPCGARPPSCTEDLQEGERVWVPGWPGKRFSVAHWALTLWWDDAPVYEGWDRLHRVLAQRGRVGLSQRLVLTQGLELPELVRVADEAVSILGGAVVLVDAKGHVVGRGPLDDLLAEINFTAEYAGVATYIEFTASKDDGVNGVITVCGQDYPVHIGWCMGNIKRLPDRTTLAQIRYALAVSHPDVKGIGPKHPPREE